MSHNAWRDLCIYGKIRQIRALFGDYIADVILRERALHKIREMSPRAP